MQSGSAYNIIPQTATLLGTCRTLEEDMRDLCERRIAEVAQGVAAAYGATAKVVYERGYPVTVNHPEQTDFIAGIGRGYRRRRQGGDGYRAADGG